MPRVLSHNDYAIGWICALPLEMAAAKLMLDEIHDNLPQPSTDHNCYTLGRIHSHNIAIACLPSGVYGTTSAATVMAQMLSTFRSIQFGLMVGIGGGVPTKTDV
jgi:nucleoside phosphorylase